MDLTKVLNGLLSLPHKVTILQIDVGTKYLCIEYYKNDYIIDFSCERVFVEHTDGVFRTYTLTSKIIQEIISNYEYDTIYQPHQRDTGHSR